MGPNGKLFDRQFSPSLTLPIYCSEDWYPVGLRNWGKKKVNPKYLLEAENGSCALAMTSGNFV